MDYTVLNYEHYIGCKKILQLVIGSIIFAIKSVLLDLNL